MKTSKKIVMLVATLLMATSVWAGGTVTVIKQLNGTVNNDAGTVTSSISEEICTLTVVPAQGNYITAEYITAERTIDGGSAQSRNEVPGISNQIEVSNLDVSQGPSGTTTYQFTMPDAEYDVEVVVNFQTRTSIATATVTLASTSFDFDGEAKEPTVTSVVLEGTTLTATTDYSVSYSDNTNAGTATVTVTGQGIYTGTATTTFTINKAALSNLSVTIEGWTYGEYNEEINAPHVAGNEGEGNETFTYADATAAEPTFTGTVPTNAGSYIVKVAVAETDNYAAGEATANFTIEKAELGEEVIVSITGWTFGDEPNAPSVEGIQEETDITYTYITIINDEEVESATVPTNAGSYQIKATIAESTNYNGGVVYNEFSIAQADFSQVAIADIENQTYTGSAITPAITVTFKGNTIDDSEYDVNYASNTDVGTATVTITSKEVNFFKGQNNPTKTFQIVAAAAVITGTDQTVTYNGQAQPYTNGAVDKGTLVVTYYDSEAARGKGSNGYSAAPTNAGTYYVKLTQSNTNYTSEPVDVTFTINPKTLTADMMWSEGDSFVYSGEPQTLADTMFGLSDGEYDLVYDTDFEISYANNVNVGTATATITGKGNYTGTLTKNFDIVRELNITFSEVQNWATYYAQENLQVPEGLKAYIVTSVETNTVTVEEVQYIPQHQGVLLTYEEDIPEEIFAYAYTGATQEFTDNLLKGVSASTAVSTLASEDYAVYVLYNDEFVKSTTGNIPAFRCYLEIETGVIPSARLSIIIDHNNTTGITTLSNVKNPAYGVWYDLNGRRLNAQPTAKGLYILNGRKYVVK